MDFIDFFHRNGYDNSMRKNQHNGTEYDVIIIGAGAAGLFCSGTFPEKVRGLILEKTNAPGTKLLMSGSGQCNITHGGSIKDFIPCYGKNGSKIRTSLYQHSNRSLIKLLNDHGVETIIREDGKVFPASLDAHEVLNLLLRLTKDNGFTIAYGQDVTEIHEKEDHSWEVLTSGCRYHCKSLILATGGCSYPTTGSDGSMFSVLKRDLRLPIAPLRPALSPVNIMDYPYADLSGISFSGVNISVYREQKKVTETQGDLLFTHQNLSGPAVINISKDISPKDKLIINYLYPQTYQQVLEQLKTVFAGSNESLPNLLSRHFGLPKRFTSLLVQRYGNSLKALAAALSGEEFIIKSVKGFTTAMATCGGIALDALTLSTMELMYHPNLFAIGEMVDIDGITGGYNLQFAYSSARAAGEHICKKPQKL
ncbi:putative Rossmann fold flavoprotein [Clostridiales Family XIII bacterium PM5-7]